MQTYILQLERFDDIVSACDKAGSAKHARLLVVWPPRGRVLTRRLDLVLLQRRARALGTPLALVTRDREVRRHARELGIVVFGELRAAQTQIWRAGRGARRRPELRPARPEIPLAPERREGAPLAVRLTAFLLGVAAVLALAAALTPQAEIQVQLPLEPQTVQLELRADPGVSAVQLAGITPITPLTVTVSGRASRPTSGQAQWGAAAAVGAVDVTNLTPVTVTLPAALPIVSRSGGRFVTDRALELAPLATRRVGVTAVANGTAGNLPAASLTGLEGTWGAQVSVTNPAPTRGGRDQRGPAATRADQERLQAALSAELAASAAAELAARLAPGDLLLAAPTLDGIVRAVFDPDSVGAPADALSLQLEATFRTPSVRATDLQPLAQAALDATLPPGLTPRPEAPILTHGPVVAEADGRFTWTLTAQRALTARLDRDALERALLGQRPAEAAAHLAAALPLAAPPQVRLIPAGWPRLPILPFRIHLTVVPGG
jgi:hypothetical protein